MSKNEQYQELIVMGVRPNDALLQVFGEESMGDLKKLCEQMDDKINNDVRHAEYTYPFLKNEKQ